MTTLPIFDPVNNVKIFNGSSQFLQIPATSINLSNGFAILATFTPTANANNECLCSFFQGTSAANSFNIARSGTGNQLNFNLINNAGITQAISLGTFATGAKYKVLVQSTIYIAPTAGTQILSQNVAKTTYYSGTSIINSILTYATSATLNFTNSGFPSTTPLYIYLYNGSSWTLAVTTTCATSSVNLLGLSASQTGLYRAAMTVLSDGISYQYNPTQSVFTSFNTPPVPTIGIITPGTNQFTIGAPTYSGGYVSGTAINYTVAVSPFTTYTNSVNATFAAASTIISGLSVNTQYQIRSIISDPANTTVFSTPIYTLATISFVGSGISQVTTTSFRVAWNAAGTPATFSKYDFNIKMTGPPYTIIADLVNDSYTGPSTTTFFGLIANTSYTVLLTPYNADNVASPTLTLTPVTLATATLAATPITAITASGFTVNWNSSANYSNITVRVNLTAAPFTQVFSQGGFTGTSAAVTGLSANIGYTVYLDALNSAGVSNAGVATTTTTTLGSVTLAGTPVTALSTTGFTVNWTASASYTSLNIRVRLTASPFTQVFSQNNLSGTSVAVTGLSTNVGYTAFFDIYNVNGLINTGGVSTSTVTLATVALAATPITNLVDTSLTVNWTAAGTPATYTSITVRANLTASPFSQIFAQTGFTGTSANVTGLSASTGYTIFLDAVNANSVTNGSVASTTTTTTAPVTLYTFSSFTFTNAGITGGSGPTLAQLRANAGYSTQSWTQDTTNNYLNMTTQGIQLWKVPKTSTYQIIAGGGAGGDYQNRTNASGKGTIVNNILTLNSGDVIKILCGQAGSSVTADTFAAGGGGATYIVTSGDVPLLIAGGGGATGPNSGTGGNATLTPTVNGGSGGTGGTGIVCGGGFSTNGASGGFGGRSFANGGAGGGGYGGSGFGGGGGTTNNGPPSSGGGGGYNGGNGNNTSATTGGTSFDSVGTNNQATLYNAPITANGGTYNDGYCTGNGFAVIRMVPLYTFTTFTFTNAGITGYVGPTLAQLRANANYSAQSWATDTTNNYLNMGSQQGIQFWTVPRTGLYQIIAAGAGATTGRGAIVSNSYTFTAGQVIKILIGQISGNSAGGGGTFIATTNNTPILVAGGAGGAANGTDAITQVSAATTGAAGQGGIFSGGQSANGGGGFSGNGQGGNNGTQGGFAFINGGAGGFSFNVGGGFGGGGSWTGGGGGYSGGNGAGNDSAPGSYGGSSYDMSGSSFNATRYTTSITANGGTYTGYCSGNGFAQITFIS